MVTGNEIIKKLIDLVQLDIDAASAYDVALKQIEEGEVHDKIKSFREDHLLHINELSIAIKNMGGKPPEISQDFKGFLIEGFTAIRSMTGKEGALHAMESNEKITNKKYKKALDESNGYPEHIVKLLYKNYGDEKRHLEYIQEVLKTD